MKKTKFIIGIVLSLVIFVSLTIYSYSLSKDLSAKMFSVGNLTSALANAEIKKNAKNDSSDTEENEPSNNNSNGLSSSESSSENENNSNTNTETVTPEETNNVITKDPATFSEVQPASDTLYRNINDYRQNNNLNRLVPFEGLSSFVSSEGKKAALSNSPDTNNDYDFFFFETNSDNVSNILTKITNTATFLPYIDSSEYKNMSTLITSDGTQFYVIVGFKK